MRDARVTLDALRQEPALAATLEPRERLALLADAEAVAGVLRALVAASVEPHRNGHQEQGGDGLIDAEEAGRVLGLSRAQVYRRARSLPGVVHVGQRTLRFNRSKLAAWVAAHGGSLVRRANR